MHYKTCPTCGKSQESEKFIGSFCFNCYIARTSLFEIEPSFEVKKCTACHKIWIGKWSYEKELKNFIKGKVKTKEKILDLRISLDEIEAKQFKATVCASFKVAKSKVEQCKETNVKLRLIQCNECSRKTSGYYEAIIQIRAKEKVDYEKLQDKAEKIARRIIKEGAFIAKIEEQKEGIDLYVSNTKTAVSVIAGHGKYALATKLAGQKQGKQLFRTTICIRF